MASKRLAALGLAAGLAGGGTVGAALGLAAVAGAQTSTESSSPSTDTDRPVEGAERLEPGTRLNDALQGLVDDGTLTEEQRQAVVDTLKEQWPGRGPDGHGPRGGRDFRPRVGLEAAASALGMTEAELRDALGPDTSVADLATQRGVDVEVVIDAIVSARKAQIADNVADGDLTQAQADKILAQLSERVTAMVNGERPPRPQHPGDGAPGGDPGAEPESPPESGN